RSVEEAAKVLSQCGYGDFSRINLKAVEEKIEDMRREIYDDLLSDIPDMGIRDVFRIKFDYHNIKVVLKSDFSEEKSQRLLVDAGRLPIEELQEALFQMDLQNIPPIMAESITAARESLAVNGDPQLADFILDKASYEEMLAAAEATDIDFLVGLVRLMIDAINLKSIVRALRLDKDTDFMRKLLLPGGDFSIDSIILLAGTGSNFESLYSSGELAKAASLAGSLTKGGSLTELEKLCDNAIMEYLGTARYTAFGPETVIGYLYAKEAEFSAIRIIMTGLIAGIDIDIIRERLREAYV
ncbi:MAG: V-type ATPase subunit, partial [Clostridiales bacterium]